MATKKQSSIKDEVKRRMRKETPRTGYGVGLSPITHLRRHLHKKQIKKELKDRPEHLSKARVGKRHGGGVGIQTHGNKLAKPLNTQTPDHSVYLNKDNYLKGGIKIRS